MASGYNSLLAHQMSDSDSDNEADEVEWQIKTPRKRKSYTQTGDNDEGFKKNKPPPNMSMTTRQYMVQRYGFTSGQFNNVCKLRTKGAGLCKEKLNIAWEITKKSADFRHFITTLFKRVDMFYVVEDHEYEVERNPLTLTPDVIAKRYNVLCKAMLFLYNTGAMVDNGGGKDFVTAMNNCQKNNTRRFQYTRSQLAKSRVEYFVKQNGDELLGYLMTELLGPFFHMVKKYLHFSTKSCTAQSILGDGSWNDGYTKIKWWLKDDYSQTEVENIIKANTIPGLRDLLYNPPALELMSVTAGKCLCTTDAGIFLHETQGMIMGHALIKGCGLNSPMYRYMATSGRQNLINSYTVGCTPDGQIVRSPAHYLNLLSEIKKITANGDEYNKLDNVDLLQHRRDLTECVEYGAPIVVHEIKTVHGSAIPTVVKDANQKPVYNTKTGQPVKKIYKALLTEKEVDFLRCLTTKANDEFSAFGTYDTSEILITALKKVMMKSGLACGEYKFIPKPLKTEKREKGELHKAFITVYDYDRKTHVQHRFNYTPVMLVQGRVFDRLMRDQAMCTIALNRNCKYYFSLVFSFRKNIETTGDRRMAVQYTFDTELNETDALTYTNYVLKMHRTLDPRFPSASGEHLPGPIIRVDPIIHDRDLATDGIHQEIGSLYGSKMSTNPYDYDDEIEETRPCSYQYYPDQLTEGILSDNKLAQQDHQTIFTPEYRTFMAHETNIATVLTTTKLQEIEKNNNEITYEADDWGLDRIRFNNNAWIIDRDQKDSKYLRADKNSCAGILHGTCLT